MKRREPKTVKAIIEEALKLTGQEDDFNAHRLCSLWPEIVGPAINRLTTRRYVDNGTFHVYLTSAVLKNELQFNRSSLVEALNRAVGAEVITDIRFH